MSQRILLVTILSVGTILLMQYFGPKSRTAEVPTEAVPGQSYTVPSREVLQRPIRREVDFIDEKRKEEEIIRFRTENYSVQFSTYGATLAKLDFLKHTGNDDIALRTIKPKTFYEQEQGAFLLALEEKTPFYYEVVEQKIGDEQDPISSITFKTQTDEWRIVKKYSINQDSYTIDLVLDFVPLKKDAQPLFPRLSVPAPYVNQIAYNTLAGAYSGVGSGEVEKVTSAADLEKAWIQPALFGGEDKYFAHMMIGDEQQFTQRAFYKKLGEHQLFSMFEGPEIATSESYKLSFYLGPKLIGELHKADARLEGLLSFGWLSWICKLLLSFLQSLFALLGNYGLAIIILTILIKVPFMPLTMKSRARMEQFQKFQPSINHIRQKYKNDTQRQYQEMMKFYKEHNISAASPLLGFLPFMIQIPIFFGLYRVLNNYLGLYHAPFFGWIVDLSTKDPYYILPILMGLSMLSLQFMMPSTDGRQKTMGLFLAAVMLAVFINFPAGLVLYQLVNNLLMIFEDFLRRRFFSQA